MAFKSKLIHRGKGTEMRRKLVDLMAKYPNANVTVGVHSDAGDYEGTNITVAQLALFHEYGTPNARFPSPERSFMRSTVKEHRDDIAKWREEAIENILFKDWTVEKALSMIGLRIQLLIQNRITRGIAPPNSPATLAGMFGKPGKIALNQGTTPLIATGKLLRSIKFKVNLNGSED